MTIATTLARTFERLRLKSLLHFRRYCAPACAHMEVSDALGHVYGTSADGKPAVERLRFTNVAGGVHAGSTAVKLAAAPHELQRDADGGLCYGYAQVVRQARAELGKRELRVQV